MTAETVTIPKSTWDMAQWEIHALRNELNGVTMRIAVHAHTVHRDSQLLVDQVHDSKSTMDDDMLAALRDPRKRNIQR